MTTVVYIGGWMRSGTTLMAEMLGDQPDVLNAGELSGFWPAVLRDDLCSCGCPLSECALWGRLLREFVAGGTRVSTAREMAELSRSLFRMRDWPLLMAAGKTGEWPAGPKWRRYVEVTSEVIAEAMAITGTKVLVDSSKVPSWLAFHRLAPARDDVVLVHLVRDPRGVAASAARTYESQPDSSRMGAPLNASPMRSAWDWSWANVATRRARSWCRDYELVLFEDLMTDPERTLARLCQVVGIEFDGATVKADALIRQRSAHVPVGNPRRFDGGKRTLAIDDRWRTELTRRDVVLVNILTCPARSWLRLKGGVMKRG